MSTEVVYLQRCLVVMWLVSRETAAVSARSVYTIQPCTMSRHFMQSHIGRVHACHLHFSQEDLDLLRPPENKRILAVVSYPVWPSGKVLGW